MNQTAITILTELNQVLEQMAGDRKALLALAPVYLLPTNGGDTILTDVVETLAEALDQNGLFVPQSSGCLTLSAETEPLPYSSTYSFTDENHQAHHSFQEWVKQVLRSGTVKGGIIALYFGANAPILQDQSQMVALLRQIQLLKRDFLFLLFGEETSADELRALLEPQLFYREICCTAPSPEEYTQQFIQYLAQYHLSCSPEAETTLLEDFSAHQQQLSCRAVDRIAQHTVWALLSQAPQEDAAEGDPLLALLHTDLICRHLQVPKKAQPIGFHHNH